MGFVQSKYDPCVYTTEGGKDALALWVDDLVLAVSDDEKLISIKSELSSTFSAKDLGELEHFVGNKVIQSENGISLCQEAYTKMVLDRFGFTNCKPVSSPSDVSTKLCKSDSESSPMDKREYQAAVGCLLYLSSWSRPDIAYAVNNVAKFSSNPSQEHWVGVKRIFRYLRGTSDYGLLFRKGESDFVGFSDSDWAGDTDDTRSTSGYVFCTNGTAVSWRSKKQVSVALSTAEAEYMALANAT